MASDQDADLKHKKPTIPTLELDPDGDVMFVVGPGEHRIRVHSLFLKKASPAFRVLLGPYSSEGQGLDSNNPKEISLPADNYNALLPVCAVIHHRTDLVPQRLPPKGIFQVAAVAEKYDCINAFYHTGCHWLGSLSLASYQLADLSYAMAAAFRLGDSLAFDRITRMMIYEHDGSYTTLAPELEDYLPWNLLCQLAEKRSELKDAVYLLLRQTIGLSNPCDSENCIWPQYSTGCFQRELAEDDSSMMSVETVSNTIVSLEQYRHVPYGQNFNKGHCYSTHTSINYEEFMAPRIEEIKEMGGLCLDCIKPGKACANHDAST